MAAAVTDTPNRCDMGALPVVHVQGWAAKSGTDLAAMGVTNSWSDKLRQTSGSSIKRTLRSKVRPLKSCINIVPGDAVMKLLTMGHSNDLQAMFTKGVKFSPKLLLSHELPAWRKDNEYLLSGYR